MKKIKSNPGFLPIFSLLLLLTLLSIGEKLHAQFAFPTAEGYGKNTKGGRGGTVYEVTNLNDSGAGSLRAAVEASGPRIVVFRVSGTITLTKNLNISNPYITIAGQTAPGDGICIKKYTFNINADEVIVRYIRVRYGDELQNDADAVSMRYRKNIILDHISASWGDDETLSLYHGENVTVQWCMISETLNRGGTHGFGGIWGSNHGTYHHNLFAHHSSRNPRMASGSGFTDYRNNVIYNWGYQSCYGGENQQVGDTRFSFSQFNIVGNYYKPGPATKPGAISYRIINPEMRNDKADFGKWFVADNIMEGNSSVTDDNWNGGVQPAGGTSNLPDVRLEKPWPSMPITQQNAKVAYLEVLHNAGVIRPKRDAIDNRIVKEVSEGYATFEGVAYKKDNKGNGRSGITGIIDSQKDVGGWCALKTTKAPADSDHDGMPDEWEETQGLNKLDPNDRNTLAADGYTMLEKYINNIK